MLPLIVLVGVVVGVRLYLRGRRERESLEASRGDAVALELEKKRRRARRTGFLVIPVWVLTFAALAWMGLHPYIVVSAASLLALAPLVRSRMLMREYNEGFKGHFVAAEFSKVFENLDYRPQEHLSIEDVRSFFTHADEVGGNDLIRAEYGGVRFEQSDLTVAHVWTEMVTDEDGNEREETRRAKVFGGRAMRFDFKSGIPGQVQVCSCDFDAAAARPSVGGWREVETELEDFRRHFRVLALDPLDAMTVLTPQMIEGIYGLGSAMEAPMAVLFKGNAMYVFWGMGHDAFEANGSRTLLESRRLLARDVRLVTDFLDAMSFRRQEGILRTRDAVGEAPRAAPKAPFPAADSWRRLRRFGRKRLGLALFGLYLAFAVYAALHLPSEIATSVQGGAPVEGARTVPALAFLGFETIFMGAVLLSGRFFIAAVLFLLQYLLVSGQFID